MSVVKILLTGTSTITLAGNQAPIFTQIKMASRSLSVLLECERHTSECIIMADLQQIIINKQILHMASLSKDKQFSTQSLSVDHMKRLKMSHSFCMQMGREEETEWLRRREGREEIGENGSGRQMRAGWRVGRETAKMRRWRRESREGMTGLMRLHEWQPCMGIDSVIREQRRWDLNGLLTGALNTASTMETKREMEMEKEREAMLQCKLTLWKDWLKAQIKQIKRN